MDLVIDANIIFTSLLIPNSREYRILMRSEHSFYACSFSIVEVFKHKEKILKYSKMPEEKLLTAYYLILERLKQFPEDMIRREFRLKAGELCADIDEKDTVYVAQAMMLNGKLWTGDKKLIKGLRSKGYDLTVTTAELLGEEH